MFYGPRLAFLVPLPLGGLLLAFLLGWLVALPFLAAVGVGGLIWWLVDRAKAAQVQRQEAEREAALFGPRHPH